jgi:hypothetical protein
MSTNARLEQRALDQAAMRYDPTVNDYDIAKDPRCLWGWGPPSCNHRFGHACFRALGHPGNCGEPDEDCPRRRPRDWDGTGRAEANR